MVSAFSREQISHRISKEGLSVGGTLSKPVTPSGLLDACLQAGGFQPPSTVRAERRADQQHADRKNLSGARVLLVEDNAINQELARDLLTSAGIVVEVAENGREALERLAQESFDAVLMDCQMPEMDGYAATRALRQQPQFRDLPIIAMTANALVGDREKVLEAGMNDHIAKPIDVDAMFSTLARHIRRQGPVKGPTPAGVDSRGAMKELKGNEKLYKRLVAMFLEREVDFVSRFRATCDSGDMGEASRLAHDLKSVSSTLGAQALAQVAEAMESACREGAGPDTLDSLLLRLDEQLKRSMAALAATNPASSTQSAQASG
jgi:CheY-like chemotaxis protein